MYNLPRGAPGPDPSRGPSQRMTLADGRVCRTHADLSRATGHGPPESSSASERTWRTQHSQGQIISLALRSKSSNPFKLFSLRDAEGAEAHLVLIHLEAHLGERPLQLDRGQLPCSPVQGLGLEDFYLTAKAIINHEP